MSVLLLLILTGTVGFLTINWYWWNRLRTVETSLDTSKAWDDLFGERWNSTETVTSSRISHLNRAAEKANVPPEELPERIDEFDGRIRDLQSRIEKMREGWTSTYWQALTSEHVDLTEPHIVIVDLEGGVHEDARGFAIHAMEQDQEVVIAVARSDATFAVGVSKPLADRFEIAANDIANDLIEEVNGGAGGMKLLATGGVESTNSLLEAVAAYCPTLEATLDGYIH